MKFIKVTNGKLEWTESPLQLISEFKLLFDRDKSEEKKTVTCEFIFIYYYCDYRSPYIEFEDKQRLEAAKREGRFPTNWEPDDCVLTAVEKYLKLQDGVEIRLLTGIKRSMETASRAIEFTNNKLSKLMDLLETFTESDLLDETKFQQYNVALDSVNTNIDRILVKASKLKENIKTLNEVEDMVKISQTEGVNLAGGKKKTNRMD